MPLWIDKKFVNMISPKLTLFKWKKPTLANFRCPICGDSKKNKLKTRGYLYTKGNEIFFRCHNCGKGLSLGNFLKTLDTEIYAQYVFESYEKKDKKKWQDKIQQSESEKVTRDTKTTDVPKEARGILDLPADHFARQYCNGRLLPLERQRDLFYLQELSAFKAGNTFKPRKPYIVIPIRNANREIVGYNCRSLSVDGKKDSYRYIKIKLFEDEPLIYGLERLNKTKQIFVFEGEFDSMFVENAIAVGGINLMHGIESLLGVDKSLITCVVDKDTRNREVVESINDLIEDGYSVVLLPGNIEGKDVNEIVVKHKLDTTHIKQLLESNTYQGVKAKLELVYWRKV